MDKNVTQGVRLVEDKDNRELEKNARTFRLSLCPAAQMLPIPSTENGMGVRKERAPRQDRPA